MNLRNLDIVINEGTTSRLDNLSGPCKPTFRFLTYEETFSSPAPSKYIPGKFNVRQKETRYDISGLNLPLSFMTSLEKLKTSSIQICVWSNLTNTPMKRQNSSQQIAQELEDLLAKGSESSDTQSP